MNFLFKQMAKVTGIVIPLSMLVGFCEECAFRGFLPLILAAKTGLPLPAVVLLSGIIFGVSERALQQASSITRAGGLARTHEQETRALLSTSKTF